MSNPNWPTVTHQVDWQHGPNAGTQTWTSLESAGNTVVRGFHIVRGRQFELDAIQVGTCSYDVADLNEYLNPANTSSPWNSGANSLALYRQIQTKVVWSGTTYYLYSGYIERFTAQWGGGGFLGNRQLDCVDALGILNQWYPPLSMAAVTSARYPLIPNQYGNFSGIAKVSLGAGGAVTNAATITVGVSGGLLGTTCVSMKASPTTATAGYALQASSIGFDAHTLGGWFQTIYTAGTQTLISADLSAFSDGWTIAGTSDGGLLVCNASGVTILTVPGGPFKVNDGNWHQVYVTWNGVSGGPLLLYVDGGLVAAGTYTPTAGAGVSVVQVGVDINGIYGAFTGQVTYCDAQSTTYTASQILDNYLSAGGWPGEPTYYNSTNPTYSKGRGKRWLDGIAWVGYGLVIDDQNATNHGGQSQEGAAPASWWTLTVRQLLQQSGTSERGAIYCDGSGNIVARDRQSMRAPAASTATLGENTGENPYLGDISFTLDATHVVNTVTVNQADGTTVTSTNAASVTLYGTRSLSISSDLASDIEATLVAQWYAAMYATPIQRVDRVVLDPASNPALWPIALGADLFKRITLTRRPPSGSTMTAQYTIQYVDHDVNFGQSKWRTTLWLAPVLTQAFTVDDATYGAIDGAYPISD